MHIVTIGASPTQLSKLRNGHNVRIKKGTGFNLIVHPNNYHLISRAFAKNKGIEVKLSPEEIDANRSVSPEQHTALQETQPEMAGEGIFGKKFDKLLKKGGVKKIAYQVGDVAKPLVKKAINEGLTMGSEALAAYAPELAPVLPIATSKLSGLANDYLDHPGKYQGSGLRRRSTGSLAGSIARARAMEARNRDLGTNYDYMGRSGIHELDASQASADTSSSSIGARRGLIPQEGLMGRGLGGQLGRREHGSIGRNAGMIHFLPPALISQPLSANFQMSHFLPVQFQKYNDGPGMVIGAGIGAGIGVGIGAGIGAGFGYGLYTH